MNTSTHQLEIALVTHPVRRPVPSRFRRNSRSRWWFAQMRRAVDEGGPEEGPDAAETRTPVAPRQPGLLIETATPWPAWRQAS